MIFLRLESLSLHRLLWLNLSPVSPPLFSTSSPSGRKGVGLVPSLHSGIVGNAGTGGSDLSSWRLTVEKYLSAAAAFFLSPPFCFLFDSDSSQLTPCLRGSRPKDELPFLLYLQHTQRLKMSFKMLTHYIFIEVNITFTQSLPPGSMMHLMVLICNKL